MANLCWPADKQHATQIWAAPLVELALSRGANLESLLRGTGIFHSDLTQHEHKISVKQLYQLITNCQKQTRSQDLSFMLGRRIFQRFACEFSQLIQHARNFGQMARIFQVYQDQLFPFCFGDIKRHDNNFYFVLNHGIQHSAEQFLFEVLCTCIYHSSKSCCEQRIPLSFNFECQRPRNIYQFEENLGTRLQFEQPLNWIKLDVKDCSVSLPQASALSRRALLVKCRELRKQHSQTGVLQYLYRKMRAGKINNLEQAAASLNVSSATFKRHLSHTGISFQQLQDLVRKQQAIFDLAVCNRTNETVAKNLRFNDVTNFRRAFKRWTGRTPGQLRTG